MMTKDGGELELRLRQKNAIHPARIGSSITSSFGELSYFEADADEAREIAAKYLDLAKILDTDDDGDPEDEAVL